MVFFDLGYSAENSLVLRDIFKIIVSSLETILLCICDPIEKERAIRQRQFTRLGEALEKLKNQIDAPHRTSQHAGKTRLAMTIGKKTSQQDWADLNDGCYLLRTNLKGKSPEELWKTYIGLTQREDSFRITKHEMGLRPIYHQKKDRAQAHILVCFLALTMWRTLQQWMDGCGLGTAPRKLLEEMAQVPSLDVVLPTGADRDIRLRTVSRPEKHLACLLQKLELP